MALPCNFAGYALLVVLLLVEAPCALAKAVTLGFNWDTWMSKALRFNITGQHAALGQLRDVGVSRVKIFSADRGLIAGISDIWGSRRLQLMIAVGNPDLASLAKGKSTFHQEKLDELMDTIAAYANRIEFIGVGNEVEYPAMNNRMYAPLLLPALEAIHFALHSRGLGHVRLTCPFSDVMIISPGNPSEADFKSSYDSALSCSEDWCKKHVQIPMLKWVLPALDFLNRTGGAFTTTVYPFYKWRNLAEPDWCTRPGYGPCINQSLAFAIGAPGADQQLDSHTGLQYASSLAVMIDAGRAALARQGYKNLQFIVGETGWPSAGISHTSNAAACWYTSTVMSVVKHGTPASNKFGGPLPIIYQFQWVDELGKYDFLGKPLDPGPIEDHFGILDTNLQQKYPVDLEEGRSTCAALPHSAFQADIPQESLQRQQHTMPELNLGFNWDTWESRILRYNITAQHSALMQLRDAGVSRVKIFSTNRKLIAGISDAWGSDRLQLMIAVGNPDLAGLAQGRDTFQQEKLDELMETISSFSSRIEFIAVGNEVEFPAINNRLYAPLLLPVLRVIHSSLQSRGLHHVRLTCPFSDMMILSSGNPSEATFKTNYDSALACNEAWCKNHTQVHILEWVLPALNFLNQTGGAFTTSLYPFYMWRNLCDPDWCTRPGYGPCSNQSLAFALGASGAERQLDTKTGLHYDSALSVMVDAVLFALARHGYHNLQFIVGETGWPTAGISHTNNVAGCWFANSVGRLAKGGTPATNKLGVQVPIIYVFQWVDELGKYDFLGKPEDPGRIEDHFGVLDSWGELKYPLDLETGRAACAPLPASAFHGLAALPQEPLWRSAHWFFAAWTLVCVVLVSATWLSTRGHWSMQTQSVKRASRYEPLLGA